MDWVIDADMSPVPYVPFCFCLQVAPVTGGTVSKCHHLKKKIWAAFSFNFFYQKFKYCRELM